MKPREITQGIEVSEEIYTFLLWLLDDITVPECVKRRAIVQCLADGNFSRKASNKQSNKFLKDQLEKKIGALLKTRNRTLLLCSVSAALIAGILGAIKPNLEQQSSPPPEEHRNTSQNQLPASPFSHESLMARMIMPRFPNKPFRIADFPWTTLDEKIKIFIDERVRLGDPTMKKIQEFIAKGTWEIYFSSPEEGQQIFQKHEGKLPEHMLLASASVWIIHPDERKDGGKKEIGVVILSPNDGIAEKLWTHRLAGTLANELTGLIVSFKNNTPLETPGQFTINWNKTEYSAPDWMHQTAGMYVLQEAISHLVDIVEEERVVTGNPQYMPSGDVLWKSLCESLRQWKFDPKDPENYARIYFGIGLQNLWIPWDMVLNPYHSNIIESEYQRWVAFATQIGNKENFLTVLRFLGTIQ